MGQKHVKHRNKELSLDELSSIANKFNEYRVLSFDCAGRSWLGVPSDLWENYILPYALGSSDGSGCCACATSVALETYFCLLLTCRTFYALMRRPLVWERVWSILVDKKTCATWRCLYDSSTKPPTSLDRFFSLKTKFNPAVSARELDNSVRFRRSDEEKPRLEAVWRANSARRNALSAWFSSLCPDEQMWLMLVARSPISTQLELTNPEDGPFRPGDTIRFAIHVCPSRRNLWCRLHNGQMGKGFLVPEDDWLTEGFAFGAITEETNAFGAKRQHPGFLGHGVSTYRDSMKDCGVVRRAIPCSMNSDPDKFSCPVESSFLISGQLMHLDYADRPLVISFKNWYVPVSLNSDGKVHLMAFYSQLIRGIDNSERFEPLPVFFYRYYSAPRDVMLDNGKKCSIAMEKPAHTTSILSNVISVPIVLK